MASLFKKDIQFLKGVGDKRAKLFYKLGAPTVGALLFLFPRTYEDWSIIYNISSAPLDTPCCIKATVASGISEARIKKGMVLYKLKAYDQTANIYITFFNNPYVKEKLKYGNEFLFFGKVVWKNSRFEMTSPLFDTPSNGKRLRPIYNQVKGLSSRQVESAIKNAISLLPEKVNDPIPQDLLSKYNLCNLKYAIENIHFPLNKQALEKAKNRLIFEELLTLQLGLNLIGKNKRPDNLIKIHSGHLNEFYKLIPFSLTNAQLHTINECIDDMCNSNFSMQRLIQGDVGSGKTVVAAALCYCVIKSGFQAAFMAPTEILAEQHFNFFSKIFKDTSINVKLLTGSVSTANKKKIVNSLEDGTIDLIIGTHAIISDNVTFNNLGLVITDEQHRFGVNQRLKLSKKGNNPHMIVMSATPIPRTLALMLYGDLDISVIDEYPKGRQKIDTFCIDASKRNRAFNFIKDLIDQGRQAYIVCPNVEENENSLASAEKFAKDLQVSEFKNYKVGLIHGKLSGDKKDLIMSEFSKGNIDLLVSTTVIEVGIDVPNAVVMMIENAERFGLSQLHQLRGRVGRGAHKSYCILVSNAQNEETRQRLNILTSTNDGFKIAQEDLNLRGPGDFFGNRQHGLPSLKIANLLSNMNLLIKTQELANIILQEDPELKLEKYKGLKASVTRLFKNSSY